MEISILCKVVDNFGDIGVVWRMAKNLHAKYCNVNINLITDNLEAFQKICSEVSVNSKLQNINGINIYNWKEYDYCYTEFKMNEGEKLEVVLECFQCGRPDWMEKILFEDKINRISHIIMIDYLTAEKYAEDFHKLKSLTRSSRVQKVNFMPGFTDKTGGLVIDKFWESVPERNSSGGVLFFAYEKNWTPFVRAYNFFNAENNLSKVKKIFLAQGRGLESIKTAFEKSAANFDAADCKNDGVNNETCIYQELPYLNQEDWDRVMASSSILFIRGEESLSRACLSGIPFVWHAYPQSDEYQLVKVKALLDRMSIHFKKQDFNIIEKVWIDFNTAETELVEQNFYEDCKIFLEKADSLVYGFKDFALSLRKNGDLTDNLMTFINEITIINKITNINN